MHTLILPFLDNMKDICFVCGLYRVIHKSMKHCKNSQQIDYATDHGNS